MDLTIAAIRSGTDPIGKLPPGAFHRWLDEPINCPKCEASYNLVAESIQRLQMVFGKVPTFLIKGDKARIAYEILDRLQKEHSNRLTYDQGKAK